MARTLLQLTAAVLKEVRGQGSALEAKEAIQNAINFIDARANWEFLLKSANLNVVAPYQTGTVTVTAGSTAVTGAGTSWSTGWRYRTILFSGRQMPYEIDSVGSTTGLTLRNALSGDTGITSGTYTIYQARYALPTDCEPGRDLLIKGPTGTGLSGQGVISKIGRMAFEARDSSYWTGPTTHYTDDEYDEANGVPTIRLGPYPYYTGEYYLMYYKKLTVPTLESASVMIPEAFEKILINRASAELMRKNSMPGWVPLQTEADELMRLMYNRYAASPAYENVIGGREEDVGIYAANSLMYTRY